MYNWAESIWKDCLWNGYKFNKNEIELYEILPATVFDSLIASAKEVTKYRRNILQLQSLSVLFSAWNNRFTRLQKIELLPVNFVQSIKKEGKHKRFILSSPGDPLTEKEALDVFSAKDIVNIEYYRGLLDEKPKELMGCSVDQLMNTWLVIMSLSKASSNNYYNNNVKNPNSLLSYAPTYEMKELSNLVVDCTGLQYSDAQSLLKYLTFNGKRTQTLWTQPLINLVNGSISILSYQANPLYVMERWLSQLSLDVSKKGSPFEDYVRKYISDSKKSDIINNYFMVLMKGFNFNPGIKSERKEQIDLIFILGKIVFIGEIKCSIVPTEPTDYFNNREIIKGAVSQAKRKSSCAKRFPKEFRRKLAQSGIKIPEDFIIEPIVIVNSAIHSGYPIDNVPVVDLLIIERYLEGRLVERAMTSPDGKVKEEYVLSLYENIDSAQDNFVNYLNSPPQLRHIKNNVRPREINFPLKMIDPSFPDIRYISYETYVDLDEVIAFQKIEAETKKASKEQSLTLPTIV